MNMMELKKQSIECYDGMIVVYDKKEEALSIAEVLAKFDGSKVFGTNNSTLAFIENGRFFVTPVTGEVYEVLNDEGFSKEELYVPFSNGDYPKEDRSRWFELRELARITRHHEYEAELASYCDDHGIGEIPRERLANCFAMPENGVHVRYPSYEDIRHPIMNKDCLDCIVAEWVGTYDYNNGRVVFNYRDGRSYVTKGYGIIESLEENGYKRKRQFVPFSNGEEITDIGLSAMWDSIKKF